MSLQQNHVSKENQDNNNVRTEEFQNKNNVPELRFPEFSDEWKKYFLKDVFDFYPTNSLSRANLNYDDGYVKNIHYGDIHTKFPTILNCNSGDIPFINKNFDLNSLKKESFCKEGDLVIADASEDYEDIGKAIELVNVMENSLVSGLHTLLLRDSNNLTAPYFRGYSFLNPKFRLEIKKIANGISVLGISKKNLEDLEIYLPTLNEQEKIANFLSLIDKKIELMEKKYQYYQDFKKYLMQQIFAQKLRFDFNEEWQKHTFKDLLNEVSEKSTTNNQYEILSSTKEGIFMQKEYFADRNVASKDNTGYKILRKNQIVLSPQNLWMGNINANTEFEIGIVSPSYKIYETTNLVKINYFKHILKLPRLLYEYKCASEQGASIVRRNLNKQLFDEITIQIPSLEEQQKIGNMLNLIDEKIIDTKKQIDESKQLKKGLLQQMFDNLLNVNLFK